MDMPPEDTILVKFFYKGETERRIEFEKSEAKGSQKKTGL
jgi:hypothetical protein